ncbi:TetR/AcrR family transcriptional regulator [Chachezhania sediminis]|uniref:TetR/AcrR family transcriptional regulator n=1 Tax=Chachezhania sediminis TaxID=2599291 RepID=UPI00131A75C6|nr:TetR/AcrR family transcriptional regulator [Chachezhania sediminis]
MSERPQRRRRLDKESRQAEILDIAAEVFSEKGYQLTSTAEIAERAGIVEGTIYRHFASKRELLNKVVTRAYEEAIADFEDHLAGIHGTWNRLRYLIWRHLKTIHDDPALARLVQYEVKTDPDYRETVVFELNRSYTRCTTRIIEDAIAAGEFHADIPVSIARDMVYGGIDHQTWSYLRGEKDIDVDRIADHIATLVYRGLARGPAPAADDTLARIDERLARIETLLEH